MPEGTPVEAAPIAAPVHYHIGEPQGRGRGETQFHPTKGFRESFVHSIREHINQRAQERQLRRKERGVNFREEGSDMIADIIVGDDNMRGQLVTPKGITDPTTNETRMETQDEALHRVAEQEFMEVWQRMFGPPPSQEQMQDPKVRRRVLEQHRQVYRLIRRWHTQMTQASHRSRTLEVSVARDRVTRETDVTLSSNAVDMFLGWITSQAGNLSNVPTQLGGALRQARERVRGEVPTEPAGSLRETLSRQAESAGRVTLGAALDIVSSANRNIGPFVEPVLTSLARALEGGPRSIIAARHMLMSYAQRAYDIETLTGAELFSFLERRLNLPEGTFSTFMEVTQGVEDRYLMEHPEDRLALLEDSASGYQRESASQRLRDSMARNQWLVAAGRDAFIRPFQWIFRTRGHRERKAQKKQRQTREREAEERQQRSLNFGRREAASVRTAGTTVAISEVPGGQQLLERAATLDSAINAVIADAQRPVEAEGVSTAEQVRRSVMDGAVAGIASRVAALAPDARERAHAGIEQEIRTRFGDEGVIAYQQALDRELGRLQATAAPATTPVATAEPTAETTTVPAGVAAPAAETPTELEAAEAAVPAGPAEEPAAEQPAEAPVATPGAATEPRFGPIFKEALESYNANELTSEKVSELLQKVDSSDLSDEDKAKVRDQITGLAGGVGVQATTEAGV